MSVILRGVGIELCDIYYKFLAQEIIQEIYRSAGHHIGVFDAINYMGMRPKPPGTCPPILYVACQISLFMLKHDMQNFGMFQLMFV